MSYDGNGKNINVYLVMNTQAHTASPSSKFCSSQWIAIAVFGRWSGVIYLAAAFLVVAFFLAGAFLAAGFFGEAFLAGLFLAGLFAFLAGLLDGEGDEPGSSFTCSEVVVPSALGSALVSLAFLALGAAVFFPLAGALAEDFLAGDFAGFDFADFAPGTPLAATAFLAGLFLGDLGADGEPEADGLAGEADRFTAFLGEAAFFAGEADLLAAVFLAGAFLAKDGRE